MISTEKKSVSVLAKAVKEHQSAMFIGSHALLIQQRKRELLQVTGGYIGIQWMTLNQLTDRILQSNGQAYVRIDQVIREDLVETVMLQLEAEEKIPLLKRSLRHAGMVKSVALWIEDLEKRSREEWFSKVITAEEPVLKELGRVYGAYVALTQKSDFPYKESEQIMYLAGKYLKELHHAKNVLADIVVVEGDFPRTSGVTQMMASIAELPAELVLIPAVSHDYSLACRVKPRCLVGNTIHDEIHKVVEDILERTGEGIGTDEIAVVTPDEAYRKFVKRELRAYGLQVKEGRSVSLLDLPVARRILSLLQLQKNDWKRASLLICTNLYARMMGLSDTEIAWGRAIIKESGVCSGFQGWLALFRGQESRSRLRFAYLQGTEDTQQAHSYHVCAKKWIRFLFRLRQWLPFIPVEATWENYLDYVLLLVELDEKQVRKLPGKTHRRAEYEAVRNGLRTRREIAMTYEDEKNIRKIKLDRFVTWYRERFSFLQLSSGSIETGLHVLLPEAIYGAEFAHVYILGLAEDSWPRAFTPHWIWQLMERKYPEHDVMVPSASEQRKEDDRLFSWALMSGRKGIILSTVLRGVRRRPTSPSCYVREWLKEMDWQQAKTEITVRDSRFIKRKISPEKQQLPSPSFFDARVPISVTGMDLYAKCAFAFFASRVLAVREEVVRQERLLPTDIGSITHQVLRTLIGEEIVSSEELVHRAVSCLDEELNRYERRYGLKGPKWEGQRKILASDLQAFIRTEADQLVKKDGVEQIAEWGFGRVHAEKMDVRSNAEPLLLQKDGRELRISGTIDRIDQSSEGFAVVDYKLSKSPTNRDMEHGYDLQMALYLIAYERLSLSRDEAVPLEGRFAVLKDPGKGGRITFHFQEEFERFKAEIAERLFDLTEEMISGNVLPRPRNLSECSHCSFQSVCRRDEYAKKEERGNEQSH